MVVGSVVTLELDDDTGPSSDAGGGSSFRMGGCSVNVYTNLHGIVEASHWLTVAPSSPVPKFAEPVAVTLPLACQSGGLALCPKTGRIIIALRGDTGGVSAFSILECREDSLDHVVDVVRERRWHTVNTRWTGHARVVSAHCAA